MTDSNGVARAYDLPVAAFELECRTPDDVDAKVRARHVDIALQAGDLDAVLGILGQSRGSVRIVATAYAELVADGDPEAMATNIRAVAAGTPRASKAELVLVHAGFDSSWSFFQSEAKAS